MGEKREWEGRQDCLHSLLLQGNGNGKITGVLDVPSFDAEQILLETDRGLLTIRGSELHISRLHLEEGEVDIEGHVDSLTYSRGGAGGRKGSLVKRLFQ